MSDNTQQNNDFIYFQIIVQGMVNESWSLWLGNISIEPLGDFHSGKVTKLFGKVIDQAALRGLINQIWDLNLPIISYQQKDPQLEEREGENYENK